MEAVTRLFRILIVVAALAACPCAYAQRAPAPTPAAKTAKGGASGDALLGKLSLTSQHEPIAIAADSLEFDYKSRVLTYKGHVVVTQADLKLESDNLRVELNEAAKTDAQIKEVIAAGNVRMEKGTRSATAGRGVFDQTSRTITLTEDAVLRDGASHVSGERVVVYLDEERSVVDGGKGSGRVKAMLYPNRDQQAKKDAAP